MHPIQVSRARLERLVVRHHGNRAAISRASGYSLNTIRRLLRLHGLEQRADELALAARRSGPRRLAPLGPEERSAVARALSKGTVAQAARALGMSVATLYRRKAAMGISTRSTTGSASDPA